MSSRLQARQYSGGVSPHSGPSLMQMLAAANGYDDTSGGPQVTTTPDGTQSWSYSQAKPAKHGFLSLWGKGKSNAAAINAQTGQAAYLQQQKGGQDVELEKLRAKLQDELGEKAGKRAADLMVQSAKEARETKMREQQGADIGAMGGVYTGPQDAAVAGQALNDPAIQNRAMKLLMDTKRMQSPEFAAGELARSAAPIYNNAATATVHASPNDVLAMPPSYDTVGQLGKYQQLLGRPETTSITPTYKNMPLMNDKGAVTGTMPFPGEPKTLRSFGMPSVRNPANPGLVDQASKLPPPITAPPLSLSQPDNSAMSLDKLDPQMLKTLLEMLQQQQQLTPTQ